MSPDDDHEELRVAKSMLKIWQAMAELGEDDKDKWYVTYWENEVRRLSGGNEASA